MRFAGWAMIVTLGLGLATEASAQAVGVLAAVNRDVTGQRPTEQPRQLVLRERLILNERVTTNSLGGGQVLFLDQTSLTLSPSSDVVLDRYLYDPDTRTGDLTVSLVKGAMRLVGGRITKQGVATIRTPSATIGIRGGIGNVSVGPDGATTYMHIAGISSTITSGGGTVTVTREGGVVKVAAPAPSGGETTGDGGEPTGGEPTGGEQTGGEPTGGETTGGETTGGEDAPPPVYVGVATPEMVSEEFSAGTGTGDGGLELELDPEEVEQEMEPVEQEITGADGAVTEDPVSTQGEKEDSTDGSSTTNEPPQEEIADNNIAEDVADNIENVLDGIIFDGTWQAFALLSNGGFALDQGNTPFADLKFQMKYSLVSQTGLVAVELPPTGDSLTAITDLNGDPLLGDKFLVEGNLAFQLQGDGSTATELGGNAGETIINIARTDTTDTATGNIFIDYTGTGLTLTDFVDGDIDPTVGERVQNEEFEQDISDFSSQQSQ